MGRQITTTEAKVVIAEIVSALKHECQYYLEHGKLMPGFFSVEKRIGNALRISHRTVRSIVQLYGTQDATSKVTNNNMHFPFVPL